MRKLSWALLAVAALLTFAGCSTKTEEAAKPVETKAAKPAGTRLNVPAEVTATWKAVIIEVTDKADSATTLLTVDIGSSVTHKELEIAVSAFLTEFMMDQGTGNFTSKSNEPINPGAKTTIKEGGQIIFDRWLFSSFADVHPFAHEKYGIVLKDFVKK